MTASSPVRTVNQCEGCGTLTMLPQCPNCDQPTAAAGSTAPRKAELPPTAPRPPTKVAPPVVTPAASPEHITGAAVALPRTPVTTPPMPPLHPSEAGAVARLEAELAASRREVRGVEVKARAEARELWETITAQNEELDQAREQARELALLRRRSSDHGAQSTLAAADVERLRGTAQQAELSAVEARAAQAQAEAALRDARSQLSDQRAALRRATDEVAAFRAQVAAESDADARGRADLEQRLRTAQAAQQAQEAAQAETRAAAAASKAELEGRVAALQREVQATLAQASDECDAQAAAVQEQRRARLEAEAEAEAVRRRLAESEAQRQDSDQRVLGAEQRAAVLAGEVAALRQVTETAAGARAASDEHAAAEVIRLSSALAAAHEELEVARQAVRDAAEGRTAALNAASAAGNEAAAATQERQALTAELAAVQSELTQARLALNKAQQALDATEAHSAAAIAQAKHAATAAAATKVETAESVAAGLHAELVQARATATAQAEAHSAALADQRQQHSAAAADRDRLAAQLRQLQAAAPERERDHERAALQAAQVQDQLDGTARLLQETQAAADGLRRDLLAARLDADRLREAEAAGRALHRGVANALGLPRDTDALDLEAAVSDAAAAQRDVSRIEAKIDGAVSGLERQLEHSRAEVARLHMELQVLQREKASAEDDAARSAADVEAATRRVAAPLEAEVQRAVQQGQRDRQAFEASLAASASACDQLRRELRAADDERASLQLRATALEAETASARSAMEDADLGAAALRAALRAAEEAQSEGERARHAAAMRAEGAAEDATRARFEAEQHRAVAEAESAELRRRLVEAQEQHGRDTAQLRGLLDAERGKLLDEVERTHAATTRATAAELELDSLRADAERNGRAARLGSDEYASRVETAEREAAAAARERDVLRREMETLRDGSRLALPAAPSATQYSSHEQPVTPSTHALRAATPLRLGTSVPLSSFRR